MDAMITVTPTKRLLPLQGTLSADLTADIEDVKDRWGEVCQFLDERFIEIRQKQMELARRPAPRPAKEPKTDAEKVNAQFMIILYK